MDAGATEYVMKPFTKAAIQDKLRLMGFSEQASPWHCKISKTTGVGMPSAGPGGRRLCCDSPVVTHARQKIR